MTTLWNPDSFSPIPWISVWVKLPTGCDASFLPEMKTVASKLGKLTQHSFSIEDGAVLEPNCTYIIPLLEELHLPSGPSLNQDGYPEIYMDDKLSARTNPKSSTGRLDIFTRVITDFFAPF